MATGLVTKEEVKRSLKPDMTGTSDDTLIDELILAVVDDAERFTGRYIKYNAAYAEVFCGDEDQKVLLLKGHKVWALTKVEFDDVLQTLTDFKLNADQQAVYYAAGYPEGVGSTNYWNIRITYTAGYDQGQTGKTPPDGLKRAVIDEVVMRYEYLRSQSAVGEQIVDLKKDFLCGRSERFFKSMRRPCV